MSKPSRYQRSAGALVGALLVTMVAILAFVALRAAVRRDLEVRPEAIDYLEAVRNLQDAGRDVVYPQPLPEGWIVTSVDSSPGERPVWGLGMLTDDGAFVGVRQEDESASDLVDTYVDEEAAAGEPLGTPGAVADSWESWTDEGGDVGYTAELAGDTTLLVYGSAGEDAVQALLERLTTEPAAG